MFGAKTIFRAKTSPPAWTTHNVLLGTQEMSCLAQGMSCFEHKERSASNTRNVLRGAQGMFCLEHKECSVSDTRNFLFRTLGVLCCEHKECSASNTKNVLLETHGTIDK